MSDTYISDSIKYIGADDTTLDLFESQYIVPNGVSYNSYIIMDEKIAVMDTVDQRKTDEWFDNLNKALDGKTPDYLVVSHLEPDHAANIQNFVEKYPTAKLVLSIKAKAMMPQFFEIDNLDDICITVKEGDTLELGEHKLTFIMAPMVHWPEVMVEYEEKEAICGPDRNSYYKTDHDATAMCLKEDYYSGLGSQMHAAYNTQIVVCRGIIVFYYLSQDRSDTRTLIPTLEGFKSMYGCYPKRICADAGYGSFANYKYCNTKGIEAFIKGSSVKCLILPNGL